MVFVNRQLPQEFIYANAAGIKQAKLEAQKQGSAVALKEFDWDNYLNRDRVVGSPESWIEQFEQDYFARRERNSKSETTWKDYQKIFKKLPLDKKLTAQELKIAVLQTKPDSRTRQKACTYFKALAKFAGIDFDPSNYAGSYSAESLELRDIPSDRKIMEMRSRIFNPAWQFTFGLMAAYGLRNYELFHCDLDSVIDKAIACPFYLLASAMRCSI